jgi:hypothetical protein
MNPKLRSLFVKMLRNTAGKKLLRTMYGEIQNLGMGVESEFNPRDWSNTELARFGHLFNGDIVNVSGWQDNDRSGSGKKYREYFPNCANYLITNYPGTRGLEESPDSIPLDLEKDPPQELCNRFDVVFNHTTLEHVFDVSTAADCLAQLSRDVVILVIPFIQSQHYDEGAYGDYWRFTPMTLDRLFSKNGFTTVYVNANEQNWFPVYIFYVASRNPEKWTQKFPPDARDLLGRKLCQDYHHW